MGRFGWKGGAHFSLGGFRQDLVDPENPYDLRRAVNRSLFDRFSEDQVGLEPEDYEKQGEGSRNGITLDGENLELVEES